MNIDKQTDKPIFNDCVNEISIKLEISNYISTPSTSTNILHSFDVYKEAKIHGYLYRRGMYLGVFDDILKLYEILYIIQTNLNETVLFCKRINNIQYNPTL